MKPAPFPLKLGIRVYNAGTTGLGLLSLVALAAGGEWTVNLTLMAFVLWAMLANDLLIDRPTRLGRWLRDRLGD